MSSVIEGFACPALAATTCTGTPLEQERKVGVPQTVERDGFDADRLIDKRLGE